MPHCCTLHAGMGSCPQGISENIFYKLKGSEKLPNSPMSRHPDSAGSTSGTSSSLPANCQDSCSFAPCLAGAQYWLKSTSPACAVGSTHCSPARSCIQSQTNMPWVTARQLARATSRACLWHGHRGATKSVISTTPGLVRSGHCPPWM